MSVYRYETVMLDKNGKRVELECSAKALVEEAGRVKLLVLARDITERRRAQQRLRRSLNALIALHEGGQVLVSSLNPEEIAVRLLEVVRGISGLSAAVIGLRDEHHGLRGGGVRRATGEEDTLGRVESAPEASEARAVALKTKKAQPFHLRSPGMGHSPHLLVGLCLPLWVEKEGVIGLLEVYGPQEDLAEEHTVKLFEGLAAQAAGALENALLYEELMKRERRLAALVGRLIGAQEEQRRRLAYEVHDGLAQIAASAYRYLQDFSYLYPQDSDRAQKELERITDLVKRTVEEARRTIANLRPAVLDDFGLESAISFEIERLRRDGFRVSYEQTLGGERLPETIETALFRVAQEALTNVRKHAHTNRLELSLLRLGEKVRLMVRDFGRGFEISALRSSTRSPEESVGLESMQEQVTIVGGELKIQSGPDVGTLVVADVPLRAGS